MAEFDSTYDVDEETLDQLYDAEQDRELVERSWDKRVSVEGMPGEEKGLYRPDFKIHRLQDRVRFKIEIAPRLENSPHTPEVEQLAIEYLNDLHTIIEETAEATRGDDRYDGGVKRLPSKYATIVVQEMLEGIDMPGDFADHVYDEFGIDPTPTEKIDSEESGILQRLGRPFS